MVAVWLILITDIENFGRWKCSVTAEKFSPFFNLQTSQPF